MLVDGTQRRTQRHTPPTKRGTEPCISVAAPREEPTAVPNTRRGAAGLIPTVAWQTDALRDHARHQGRGDPLWKARRRRGHDRRWCLCPSRTLRVLPVPECSASSFYMRSTNAEQPGLSLRNTRVCATGGFPLYTKFTNVACLPVSRRPPGLSRDQLHSSGIIMTPAPPYVVSRRGITWCVERRRRSKVCCWAT